jgi:histidine triad (HIT) family protein
MNVKDCLFCKVAAREIDAKIVAEGDDWVAFRDINPQAPTHVLVIPREHVPTTNDLRPDQEVLVGQLVRAAAEIARAEGIAEEGYRIVLNCNRGAGQSVFHLHLHLLGGRPMRWPPG